MCIMKQFYCILLIFWPFYVVQSSQLSELSLIDHEEFENLLKSQDSWNLLFKNPINGVIRLEESPVDKLQILFNTSYPENSLLKLEHDIKLESRNKSSIIEIQIVEKPLKHHVASVGSEDLIYIQLLLITVASLILVVLVFSVIFACWWVRSKGANEHEVFELDTTTTPLLVHDKYQVTNPCAQEAKLTASPPNGASPQVFPKSDTIVQRKVSVSSLAAENDSYHSSMNTLPFFNANLSRPSETGRGAATLNRRHLAKEFLDESVLRSGTATLPHNLGQRPFLVIPEDGMDATAPTTCVISTTVAENIPVYMSMASSAGLLGDSSPILSPSLAPSSVATTLNHTEFIQELAACPQHSYLVKQNTSGIQPESDNKAKVVPAPPERGISLGETQTLDRRTQNGHGTAPNAATSSGSATLTSPKSALKTGQNSNDNTPAGTGPMKVGKQLRFTTLSLVACACVVTTLSGADAFQDLVDAFGVLSSRPILSAHQLSRAVNSFAPFHQRGPSKLVEPRLETTIWLPRSYLRHRVAHTASTSLLAPREIILWLNASADIDVLLGHSVPRDLVQIYDVKSRSPVMSSALCKRRYSCQHACESTACICQRGFALDTSKNDSSGMHYLCKDVNECEINGIRDECTRRAGKCVNMPGEYQCRLRNAEPALPCDTVCPKDHFRVGNCTLGTAVQCKKCTASCSANQIQVRPCMADSDLVCEVCGPSCTRFDFEYTSCGGRHNRTCKSKSIIPEMEVQLNKNVWFENKAKVHHSILTINEATAADLMREGGNRTFVLERGSGFKIRLQFEAINLRPVLREVDHQFSNDNAQFLASQARHEYSSTDSFANRTLRNFCHFPLPPNYRLSMNVRPDVLTSTARDDSLPGYRPIARPCTDSDQLAVYDRGNEATVSCLEPSSLTNVFDPRVNELLAQRRLVYVEEKRACAHLKQECAVCLAERCGRASNITARECRPTASRADNGRSDRLSLCFDCCARDNCRAECSKYSSHRCTMKMCSRGVQADFRLQPEWPRERVFLCHVEPDEQKPVFRLRWSILGDNGEQTPDRFPAAFTVPRSGSSSDSANSRDILDRGGGTFSQLHRNLLQVDYQSGLRDIPDLIVGEDKGASMRDDGRFLLTANRWSRQRNALGDNYAKLHTQSMEEEQSLRVWPRQPLEVNTQLWSSMEHSPCSLEDRLPEKLNLLGDSSYRALNDVHVNLTKRYSYEVRHGKHAPKLTFSVAKEASLLGAAFDQAAVSRDHTLRTSLAFLPDQQGENHWVIEFTGEVSRIPGLFRLQVLEDNQTAVPYRLPLNTERDEDLGDAHLLLDYEIGVFVEKRFQLTFRIPGPPEEPDYEKAFRLRVLDANDRLEIRVKRLPQPAEEMELRRQFSSRSSDLDFDSKLRHLLPSLSSRQASPSSSQSSKSTDIPIGPPAFFVRLVIGVICLLTLLLAIGYVAEQDPRKLWLVGKSPKASANPENDAMRVTTAITNQCLRRGQRGSKWKRVAVLISYLCVKSVYSFGVTGTALVIAIRYLTRETLVELSALSEMGGVSTTQARQSDVIATSMTRQKLLQDKMDVFMAKELARQQDQAMTIAEACEAGTNEMFLNLQQKLGAFSEAAADRRSRVLLTQAIAELSRETTTAAVHELTAELARFNKSLHYEELRLRSIWNGSLDALAENPWLEGARAVYADLARQPGRDEPLKPFLEWAKLVDEHLSSNFDTFRLSLAPGALSTTEPTSLNLPLPPRQPDSDASEEPRFGPAYRPFQATPHNEEVDALHWADESPFANATPSDSLSKKRDPQKSSELADEEAPNMTGFRIRWVHILGSALVLDGLWLIHRVLHTVDTAEKILYGIPVIVDFTKQGLQEALMGRSRVRQGFRRLFEASMRTSSVRKVCLVVLSLLAAIGGWSHLDRLLTEPVLDQAGYYDNLILPVHLHARFVNLHLTQSAERLSSHDIGLAESQTARQFQDAQFVLFHWTAMLDRLERKQCELLLSYKEAAERVREENKRRQWEATASSSGANTKNSTRWKLTYNDNLFSNPVPAHCKETDAARADRLQAARHLDPPQCPVDVIVPNLFKEYNATVYFSEIVGQSHTWLYATRKLFASVVLCVFVYLTCVILWNVGGSVTWFYARWLGILPTKMLYESDFKSWQTPPPSG